MKTPIVPDIRARMIKPKELKTGLTPRHQLLLDNMLMHPLWSRKQHAQALGVTEMTIYNIWRSDAFQALWVERRKGLDKLYEQRVGPQLEEIIEKGLKRMNEALDEPDIDPAFALQVFEKTHKARFGDPRFAPQGQQAQTIYNQVLVAPQDLAAARQLIMNHAKSEKELIPECSVPQLTQP